MPRARTRSSVVEHATRRRLALLPFRVGPYSLGVLAEDVADVTPLDLLQDEDQALYRHLGVLGQPTQVLTLLCGAPGPGARLRLAVCATARLIHAPLGALRGVPWPLDAARGFIFGVVDTGAAEGALAPLLLLVDPARLAGELARPAPGSAP